MSRLYWKIFLWFWLAMLLIIVATAVYSSYFIHHRYGPMRVTALLNMYAITAAEAYDSGGDRALERWLRQVNPKERIHLFVQSDNGQQIMPRSPRALRMLERPRGPIIRVPLQTKRVTNYQLVAILPPHRMMTRKRHESYIAVRFIFAIIITGVICYILSVYLTRPLRKLKIAASQIAEGKLSTRVSQQIQHRKDEISDLAHEFDNMAEKIETLVTSQKQLMEYVSHELRSPLARLQVSLELARRNSPQAAESALDRIELEATRLNDLIGEILSLANLQRMDQALEDKQDIVALLKDIIADADLEFAEQAKSVDFNTDRKQQVMTVNARLLRRSIENVLRNALRYNPSNSAVNVTLRCQEDGVTITVRDHGPGVAPADLEAIFMPFYRSDQQDQTGYGLGLAIAKQAVKIHHGSITAQNADGGGLEVTITIPQ
ncbi:MAG: hypothetical protein CMF50_02190 [Legionellales bacterium]|nr:hypothetical protein [Legionellales bacterium]|tara:strand:- start:40921 stop:42219 length:1299 start_codon:yes stop_codon:yes gene_type:complete